MPMAYTPQKTFLPQPERHGSGNLAEANLELEPRRRSSVGNPEYRENLLPANGAGATTWGAEHNRTSLIDTSEPHPSSFEI